MFRLATRRPEEVDEIRTIFVTIEPQSFNRLRISVEIQTHYARSYKLLNRAGVLSFSHCPLLEHARDMGLHIIYRRIVKGSGEMVVIHEVEPKVDLLSLLENEPVFNLDTEINPGLVDQNQAI